MIRLEKICKSFGHLVVLRDVTLEVEKGEVVCVIGPSGAGKSTMLRCINHLETLNSGTIYIEGQPVYRYMRDGKLVVDREKRIGEMDESGGEIVGIDSHQQWNLVRRRWLVCADLNVDGAPVSGPVGHEIARDREVELASEVAVQGLRLEIADGDPLFDHEDWRGEQRSQLPVGQDAARRLEGAGGVARRCRTFSHVSSTGSFSKAIESAT